MIAIWWELFINGRELSQEERNCVADISFSNPVGGSDTVSIKLNDPEMKFIEDNIYVDNAPIRIRWGVHDTLYVKDFEGYISAIDIDLPSSDVVNLTLTVMDKSHIMNRDKKKRSWENTSNDAVVKQVAKEYGFKCVVESGYTFKIEETISQDNKTDLALLEDLASNEDEKFYCKLVGDTIYYCKQGLLKTPTVGLSYRKYPYDLISFKPQITIEDKQENESTSDVDSSTLTTNTSTVNSGTAVRDVQGDTSPADPPVEPQGGHVYDPVSGTWS